MPNPSRSSCVGIKAPLQAHLVLEESENVLKAECLLASEMNGKPLTEVYGAPLRLRVENQLGYKMVKWIERIEFIESEKSIGLGEGGKNEDDEYFDLLPNI
jgi:DMSO/TMAO reductase YedYZ molybdopterin-dependent catalytic subunit